MSIRNQAACEDLRCRSRSERRLILDGKLLVRGSVPMLDLALGKRLAEAFTLERSVDSARESWSGGTRVVDVLFGEQLPRIC